MTDLKSTTGAQSTGDEINWSYLNEDRVNDPIISALMKEANSIFIKKDQIIDNSNNQKIIDSIEFYITPFNNFLKDKKYKFSMTVKEKKIDEKSDKKKGKKEKEVKLSKKDLILQGKKEDDRKKDIDDFLLNLNITNHISSINKNPIIAYFNIIYWTVYLIHNKKKDIDLSIYFNCAISLYKAIEDSKFFLTEDIINESNVLLGQIEEFIRTKISDLQKFEFIKKNQNLLLESFWDKGKPKSIALYDEQKDIISLVTENLFNKLFIFFEMPPANGKTQLSAILAKIISYKNKEYIETIPNYKRKTMLYICYNTIVRNEVAKLCITHNIDIRYWLAITQHDKEDGKIKTFLRPYKNCYPDWNKKGLRSKKEDAAYHASRIKRFSENIRDQWEFSLEETRPVSDQYCKIKDYENADNLPEMIISDLDSAYELLKAYPDTFVTYFDEAFASSELEITSKIMSVLGLTVLVSATLAKPSEIPNVLSDFKVRHNHEDDNFIHIIKSNRQHISCTFINNEGNIFAPHDCVETIDKLEDFVEFLDVPLIKRAYSPDVVIEMTSKVNAYLPEHLKFDNVFNHYGLLSHESIREYAGSIIKLINFTKDNNLFTILKCNVIKKIQNMDLNTIFTSSAVNYQNGNSLHVSTLETFNKHVEDISNPFLEGSPKISNIMSEYDKSYNSITTEIKSLEKNKTDDSDMEILELQKAIDNLKVLLPQEFIFNSKQHASKFGNSRNLIKENLMANITKDKVDVLDELRGKLLFSNIGVYQPETFNNKNMDLFLRNKDNFKFILSTPSIVYGTNINLSIIDIDSSFVKDSTKNTLYQLIGRAGRRGRSNSATIIFRDNNMLNVIFKNEATNIEAENIENNYLKLLK